MLPCGSLERVSNLLPEMNFCSQVYIFKFTEVEIYCNKTRENHWRDVLEVEQDKRKTNTENTIFLAGFEVHPSLAYSKQLCVSV